MAATSKHGVTPKKPRKHPHKTAKRRAIKEAMLKERASKKKRG